MTKVILAFLFLSVSILSFSQTPADSLNLNDTTIYTTVDTAAHFPGGRPAWVKFITKNLNPLVGVDNGASEGKYDVIISFTVTRDGTLKDFKPQTKYKHGFEEEVIRVLKLSPKWIPAKKNGIYVNSITSQNQLFIIEKG
jgi:hypothetical protein